MYVNDTSVKDCYVISFCNTSVCDALNSDRPSTCSECDVPSIAILFVVQLFLSLFIVFGNVGIIAVIVKNPVFHNPFNVFRCSLAVADLLVGLMALPASLVETFIVLAKPYEEGTREKMLEANASGMPRYDILMSTDSLCSRIDRENKSAHGLFFSIIGLVSVMASIFTLVLLSIDRFLAVFSPIKYNQGRALNNRIAAFLVLLVWMVCIILSAILPTTMGQSYFEAVLTSSMIFTFEVSDSDAGFFYTLFAVGFPYVLLLGLNVATGVLLFRKWAKIKKRTENKAMMMARMNSNNNNNARHKIEVKATVTLLVMVLVFTVSTVPSLIFLMMFYQQYGAGEYNDGYAEHTIYIFLLLLMISNSAWNIIIYSWRNENFRKALMKLMFKTMRKGKSLSWTKIKSMTARRDRDRKRRRKMYASERDTPASGEKELRLPSSGQAPVISGSNAHPLKMSRSVSGSSVSMPTSRCTAISMISPERSPQIAEEDNSVFFAEDNKTEQSQPKITEEQEKAPAKANKAKGEEVSKDGLKSDRTKKLVTTRLT